MREIKFRVWFTKNHDPGTEASMDYFNFNQLDLISGCMEDKECRVMQYTGLKDKNGKEIYEGDIVRLFNQPFSDKRGLTVTAKVIFSAGMFITEGINIKGFSNGMWSHLHLQESLVIGNIHENPELLEEDKDE